MSNPLTIEEFLADARSRLDRVAPEELESEIEAGAILVDVRDSALRNQQGEFPGAEVIDLTVLEWRLAPSSAYRKLNVQPGQRVILVCNEGYSSSLAAARLQALGIPGATDLDGGFKAWQRWRKRGLTRFQGATPERRAREIPTPHDAALPIRSDGQASG